MVSYDIINPFEKEWGTNLQFGYSVKTNRDKELITYANTRLKWNIEVVSPDEYFYVKSLGICEEDIILNGPCKIDMRTIVFAMASIGPSLYFLK